MKILTQVVPSKGVASVLETAELINVHSWECLLICVIIHPLGALNELCVDPGPVSLLDPSLGIGPVELVHVRNFIPNKTAVVQEIDSIPGVKTNGDVKAFFCGEISVVWREKVFVEDLWLGLSEVSAECIDKKVEKVDEDEDENDVADDSSKSGFKRVVPFES